MQSGEAQHPQSDRQLERRLLSALAVLALLYLWPLIRLFRYAWSEDLHSHILLVPFVCGYLWFQDRNSRTLEGRGKVGAAALLGVLAVGVLAVSFKASGSSSIVLQTCSFYLAVWSVLVFFLSGSSLRAIGFIAGFLVFLIPLPDAAVDWIELKLMVASADASALVFALTEIPILRNGQVFEMPNIVLEVAQECSGIRSSWVLFITSILAAHLFLKKRLNRLILVLVVVPLGIFRNALRITTIGYLGYHVGPHMVDSWVHHRGGPLFFAISLIPFFALLLGLRWLEGRSKKRE